MRQKTVIIAVLFFFFLVLLGLCPWHMEVPRLRGESNCSCWTSHSSQQRLFQASTIAHSNARSLTHWVRPGIEPVSSWMLVRFVSAEPQQELQDQTMMTTSDFKAFVVLWVKSLVPTRNKQQATYSPLTGICFLSRAI